MSYEAIIRSYLIYDHPRSEEELRWFASQPSLRQAIVAASLAKDHRGKRYRHQTRIPQRSLEESRRVLVEHCKEIERCSSFDDLFDLIEALTSHIPQIGELYVYDIALRIGAKLGTLPDRVYLHRGTRDGAKALGLDPKARAHPITAFPSPFADLAPHEIEDVLCIYKRRLGGGS
jgi:hypothetical protein